MAELFILGFSKEKRKILEVKNKIHYFVECHYKKHGMGMFY